jgi:hypothetical protein
MSHQRHLRYAQVLAQSLDVVQQSGYGVVVIRRALAAAAATFIQIDHLDVTLKLSADSLLKAIAVVPGPAMQVEQWCLPGLRSSGHLVPKAHAI